MRAIIAVSVTCAILAAGCTGPPASDGSGDPVGMERVDPDGTWWVEAGVTSCYSHTEGNTIAVVDGAFGKTLLYTYEVDGNQQAVSVEGTMAWENGLMRVEGTMWVEGDACDGGNGFSGWLEPATDGTVHSFWGFLHFTKQ